MSSPTSQSHQRRTSTTPFFPFFSLDKRKRDKGSRNPGFRVRTYDHHGGHHSGAKKLSAFSLYLFSRVRLHQTDLRHPQISFEPNSFLTGDWRIQPSDHRGSKIYHSPCLDGPIHRWNLPPSLPDADNGGSRSGFAGGLVMREEDSGGGVWLLGGNELKDGVVVGDHVALGGHRGSAVGTMRLAEACGGF
ncbi:hypothetical protein V6N11_035477 [Hibiscus sabdariffa]|uniref:Uncharacterized protein n=1 Tax=Hibiscus sabdariffa TaxID=183260 RepID=A0ABR2R0M9_9ROSI